MCSNRPVAEWATLTLTDDGGLRGTVVSRVAMVPPLCTPTCDVQFNVVGQRSR